MSTPFEFPIRAGELERLDGQQLTAALAERDRQLEDYLADLHRRITDLENP